MHFPHTYSYWFGTVLPTVLLWAVLGFNLWSSFRTRRHAKELLDSRAHMLRNYIEALTEVTAHTCPFCAVAGGHGRATVTDETGHGNFGAIEADEEIDGWHEIRTPQNPQPHKMPCCAAPLRQACRQAFEELMQQQVLHAKVKE